MKNINIFGLGNDSVLEFLGIRNYLNFYLSLFQSVKFFTRLKLLLKRLESFIFKKITRMRIT